MQHDTISPFKIVRLPEGFQFTSGQGQTVSFRLNPALHTLLFQNMMANNEDNPRKYFEALLVHVYSQPNDAFAKDKYIAQLKSLNETINKQAETIRATNAICEKAFALIEYTENENKHLNQQLIEAQKLGNATQFADTTQIEELHLSPNTVDTAKTGVTDRNCYAGDFSVNTVDTLHTLSTVKNDELENQENTTQLLPNQADMLRIDPNSQNQGTFTNNLYNNEQQINTSEALLRLREQLHNVTKNHSPTLPLSSSTSDNGEYDNGHQRTDNLQPTTDNRQQITDNRQPISDNRQHATRNTQHDTQYLDELIDTLKYDTILKRADSLPDRITVSKQETLDTIAQLNDCRAKLTKANDTIHDQKLQIHNLIVASSKLEYAANKTFEELVTILENTFGRTIPIAKMKETYEWHAENNEL